MVGFYGMYTIVDYLTPNPLRTHKLNIYLIWLGLWYVNQGRLFNAKSSSYIYIKYICFDLVESYGMSTMAGYFIQNHIYTYILNIYGFTNHICIINILNRAGALLSTQIKDLKYCYIVVTSYHQSFICPHSLYYFTLR